MSRSELEELSSVLPAVFARASGELRLSSWQMDEFEASGRAAPATSMPEVNETQRARMLDLVAGTYRKDRMVWDTVPPSH